MPHLRPRVSGRSRGRLGQAQFERFTAWLTAEETKSSQTLFVVSAVPIVHWINGLINFADLGKAKDDFMDEWGHQSNQWERNQLLGTIFNCIGDKDQTLVFLSGDVHCSSIFKIRHKKFPTAKVFQVTSSGISRKPAPEMSILGISAGGPMDGDKEKEVSFERLYALAGVKNFAIIRVPPLDGANEANVIVDLYWPGGDESEVTKKRILLA